MKRIRYAVATVYVAVISSAAPIVASACDSCWGASVDTPTTRGITMAMLALIGMTSVVWGGIGAFFLHVRRRSRLLEPGNMTVDEFGAIHSNDE